MVPIQSCLTIGVQSRETTGSTNSKASVFFFFFAFCCIGSTVGRDSLVTAESTLLRAMVKPPSRHVVKNGATWYEPLEARS